MIVFIMGNTLLINIPILNNTFTNTNKCENFPNANGNHKW